jgi:hypothetical protein
MFAHRTRGLSSNNRVNVNNALGNHNENLPASNLQKPSANVNVLKPSNSNGNITKTPAASIRRRALGDISNKKGGDNSIARGGGGKPKSGDTNTSTRKPAAKIWNDSVTPRRLPLQPSSVKQQQQQSNKPKEVSSLKPSRTVAFQLPQRQHPSQSLLLPQTKTFLQEPLAEQTELGPVDDVEFPAGRLFCDQVENDDDDDSSVLSMEPPLTMWDDWKSALKLQVEEQQQLAIEQDAKLQAKINRVMEQDGT